MTVAPQGGPAAAEIPGGAARLKVGSLVWHLPSEIHEIQGEVIAGLGHAHCYVHHDAVLPPDLDLLLIQGPYGSLLPMALQLRERPPAERPVLVYWYQQNLDLATPLWIRRFLIPVFSDLQRHDGWGRWPSRLLSRVLPQRLLDRGGRLRGIGDLLWLHRNGLLDVLGLSSTVYADCLGRLGIDAIVVPRGYHPSLGRQLGVERDIDLVWMGRIRSRYRRLAIEQLARQLAAEGYKMEIYDGVDKPLIYGSDRTRVLNRARFVLNVSSHADDELSIRFFIAAANGAVIMSEPNNNRYPFEPQTHFLSLPVASMPAAIDHYARHEDERRAMAERMIDLVSGELTLEQSIRSLLDAARHVMATRQSADGGGQSMADPS